MRSVLRGNKGNLFAVIFLTSLILSNHVNSEGAQNRPRFRVLALSESGGHHIAYSKEAKIWLNELAAKENFRIDYIENTDSINEAFLSQYQLFIQLDFVPYGWKPAAVADVPDGLLMRQ